MGISILDWSILVNIVSVPVTRERRCTQLASGRGAIDIVVAGTQLHSGVPVDTIVIKGDRRWQILVYNSSI